MPTHPLTRIFSVGLVAIYAAGVFLPGSAQGEWLRPLCFGSVPVLVILLIWMSVAKGVPPLEDRAFHRTLPVSANRAMLHSLVWPMITLAGCAVVTVAFCWYNQLGRYTLLSGFFKLSFLAAFMAACGLTAVLTAGRSGWKPLAVLVIVGSVAASLLGRGLTFMAFLMVPMPPSMTLVTVVTALAGYSGMWWLAAVRRRRSVLFPAAWLGLLLPWLPGMFPPRKALWQPRIKWGTPQVVRHTTPAGGGGTLQDESLPFGLKGLHPGDLVQICIAMDLPPQKKWKPPYLWNAQSWLDVASGRSGQKEIRISREEQAKSSAEELTHQVRAEVSEGLPSHWGEEIAHVWVSLTPEGKLAWGPPALMTELTRKLPEGWRLTGLWNEADWRWDRNWGEDVRPVLARRVAETGRAKMENVSGMTGRAWKVETSTNRLIGPLIFDVMKGGTAWIPGGGRVWVDGLSEQNGEPELNVSLLSEEFTTRQKQGAEPQRMDDPPAVVIVDDLSKEAWLAQPRGGGMNRAFLGSWHHFRVPLGKSEDVLHPEKESSDLARRIAALPHCRVCLFWGEETAKSHQYLEAPAPSN